jgi:hypothetical protein
MERNAKLQGKSEVSKDYRCNLCPEGLRFCGWKISHHFVGSCLGREKINGKGRERTGQSHPSGR